MVEPKDRPDLIPLIDLDPQQAEDVCDAMANVGLEVIKEELGRDPGLEGFNRGLIRIYVPRAQLRDARDVVRGVLPEYGAAPARPETLRPSEADSWSQIVADLRAEGVGTPDAGTAGTSAPEATSAEPGFTPPPPPPMPRPTRVAVLAWGAMLIGLGLLLIEAASQRTGLMLLVGLVAFIGGFVGVISLARRERSADDDHDDGAVV